VPGLFSRGEGSGRANPLAGKVSAAINPAAGAGPGSGSPAGSAQQQPGAPGEGATAFPGGYNVPSPGRFKERQKVARAWGEMVVEPGALTLRAKRRRIATLIPPIRLEVAEVSEVAPILPEFLGPNHGVAIRRHDGEYLYLWTEEPEPVLDCLEAHGFVVSRTPVRARHGA
jgi:hypothetical protein